MADAASIHRQGTALCDQPFFFRVMQVERIGFRAMAKGSCRPNRSSAAHVNEKICCRPMNYGGESVVVHDTMSGPRVIANHDSGDAWSFMGSASWFQRALRAKVYPPRSGPSE